jgi:hypothetical protein
MSNMGVIERRAKKMLKVMCITLYMYNCEYQSALAIAVHINYMHDSLHAHIISM